MASKKSGKQGKSEKKFYVVWKGTAPGIYKTWSECEFVTKGYTNAKYKSFKTLESAENAFREGPDNYWGIVKPSRPAADSARVRAKFGDPISNSLCVDAACNTVTKVMEYRGIWYHDLSLAFHKGPIEKATNNLGEFLAIVHALALLAKESLDWPIYSDSRTAICWVRQKEVNSKPMQENLTSARVNDLVARALRWLNENQYSNQILKWETAVWGEVPADFGRKK